MGTTFLWVVNVPVWRLTRRKPKHSGISKFKGAVLHVRRRRAFPGGNGHDLGVVCFGVHWLTGFNLIMARAESKFVWDRLSATQERGAVRRDGNRVCCEFVGDKVRTKGRGCVGDGRSRCGWIRRSIYAREALFSHGKPDTENLKF
jgi:hypothetical protein